VKSYIIDLYKKIAIYRVPIEKNCGYFVA